MKQTVYIKRFQKISEWSGGIGMGMIIAFLGFAFSIAATVFWYNEAKGREKKKQK